MLLLCDIKEELIGFDECSTTHSGFVLFTGFFGEHYPTPQNTEIVLPAYDEVENLHKNHREGKFNCVLSTPKLLKNYNNMMPGNEKDAVLHNLEPNCNAIVEVEHLVRFYKSTTEVQTPAACEVWLDKIVQNLKTEIVKDEVPCI